MVLWDLSDFYLQGISPTQRAAVDGLIPALEIKPGRLMPHPQVQLLYHHTVVLNDLLAGICSFKKQQDIWICFPFTFLRQIPGRSQGPRPTADWSPDTDPPPGPLRPCLLCQLWFCTHWETSSHWYHYYLIVYPVLLLHLDFFPWCNTGVCWWY